MAKRRRFMSFGRVGRVAAAAAMLATIAAGAEPTLDDLYGQARRASQAEDDAAYEAAAGRILARGESAAAFLAAKVRAQAERVGTAEEFQSSGIQVTIALLGRMNAYPDARAALGNLRGHPVEPVARWARYALAREPQTRPAGAPAGTRPSAAGPASRRVVGDRIITPEGWFARPKVSRPALPEEVSRAFVIPLREQITDKTFDALARKAVRCKTKGEKAELLIIDMDTWGGAVGASLDIARLLKADLKDVYTVCFARTRAVSGGALVAVACDEIVMASVGKLGDCAPLLSYGKLEGVEREKIETVLRAEFAESAEQNGFSIPLAKSLVSADLEVWLIRNDVTRELRYVLKSEWQGRVRVPAGVTDAVSERGSDWELLRVVVREDKLPTWRSREAVEYGFASGIVEVPPDDPLAGLLERFNVTGDVTVLSDTWSETMVEWLNSSGLTGLLFFLGLLAFVIELRTPGIGLPLVVAVVCFAVVVGSRYLTGLAQWWEIALFVLGLILLAVEVFVIPGFGVTGIAGIICCAIALLAMLVPNAPDKLPLPRTELDWTLFTHGLFAMIAGLTGAVIAAAVLARYLPKVPVAGRLVLAPPVVAKASPATEDAEIHGVRSGQVGKVVQTCRPVGKVQVGGILCDAVADGAFLPAGRTVVVLRNEGNRLVVEAKGE